MPYISYEEFDRQQAVADLIISTFTEYRELDRLNDNTNTTNQAYGDFYRKKNVKRKSRRNDTDSIHEGDYTIFNHLGEKYSRKAGLKYPGFESVVE